MSKRKASDELNICVGVITAVNGVKGYVKIRSFTENPADLANFKEIFDGENNQSFKISVVATKKDYLIAGIEGVSNRNDAEKLRNTKLYINRNELPKPNNDEYYHADLLGLEAKYQDGTPVGIVKNVLNFGAGDIVEIYDYGTERTLYFPFTKRHVPEVNIIERFLVLLPLDEMIAAND